MIRDLVHKVYGDEIFLEAFVGRHVVEHGREFVPIKRPKGIHKGRDRCCFANAQGRVLWGSKEIYGNAQYVEGFACSKDVPNHPIHHGWITLDGVHAIDVTWPMPGTHYLGVVFETKAIADHTLQTEGVGAMLSDMMRPTVENYWHIARVHLRKFNDLHPVVHPMMMQSFPFCGAVS